MSPMQRLLLGTLSLFSGYHALLVLTPLYLADRGATGIVVGLATGTFMLLAVGGHVIAPAVARRWGTRGPFATALVATGLAAVAHIPSAASILVLLLSAVRGAVYGIGAVVSATAVAHLAPPRRRARALATYGFAAALPGLVASTAAVFVAERLGFGIAFAAVGVAMVLCVPLVAGTEGDEAVIDAGFRVDNLGPAAFALAGVFAAFAMVYGSVLTFVPVALVEADAAAYPFVLATALGLAAFRWGGGTAVGRWPPAVVLGIGLALGGSGMLLLASLPAPAAPLAGFVFGAGFGLGGTATHSLLTTTTERASLGRANAIFNVAWSGGMGVGATAFGAVTGVVGTESSYLLAAAWHGLIGVALGGWFLATARRTRPTPQRSR